MSDIIFHPWGGGRSPSGAVEAGVPAKFVIKPGRGLCVTAANLVLELEGDGKFTVPMASLGVRDLADVYECDFTPPRAGLYYYWFELSCVLGSCFLCPEEDDSGTIAAVLGGKWQLTVYEPDFVTPRWPRGGLIYQIFPDRFYRQGDFPPGLPSGRICHEEWGAEPEYRPDGNGQILNNDYFGGNLRGILEKLPYLQSLGVTVLYLNPIFEAHSNHRYNTADYFKIDPMLGSEEDFKLLCAEAEKRGMHVLLDGVFNHTGDDSVYFNRRGRYPEPGAYQSQNSRWFPWYRFSRWPEQYASWWGFLTLPAVNGEEPGYVDFITGRDGVVRYWMRAGAWGWRLDVADELPPSLIEKIRGAVKEENPEGLLVGEVWEDASNKISYGCRRRYFQGRQFDSVMNYPFRDAIIDFLRSGDAFPLKSTVECLLEHYPPQCVHVLMNILGTHDTPRLLTVLAGESGKGRSKVWKSTARLSQQERREGIRLVQLAAALQFFLPGVPCLYYGDEVGLEGYEDPFNRRCFPWKPQEQQQELLGWFQKLSRLRAGCPALAEGSYRTLAAEGGLFAFVREGAGSAAVCAVNTGKRDRALPLPGGYTFRPAARVGEPGQEGENVIPAGGCAIYLSVSEGG